MNEYHYDDFILRFDEQTLRFRECTLLPYELADISLDGHEIQVTWDHAFLEQACRLDGAPVLSFGFVVLRKRGIAITGIHDDDKSQLAVTVFSEGDFDEFAEDDVDFDVSCI